jgi:protein TonB
LALDADADERSIRRAYARELKRINPEEDPAGFQALREAYDAALRWERRRQLATTDAESKELEPVSVIVPVEFKTSACADVATDAVADGFLKEHFGEPVSAAVVPRPVIALETSLSSEPVPGDLAPDEAAAAVYSDFLTRLAPLVTVADWNSDAVHKRELEVALGDLRLTNLAARELFEWRVACTLVAGWQPGHEALFVAAARVFNWNQERRGLTRFGQVGDILNRALDERATYDQLTDMVKKAQRDIIARLRDPAVPSHGELINKLPVADAIVRRYPTWVPLVTNMENLRIWHLLSREIPGWRRAISAKVTWLRDLDPVQKWLLVFVVVSALVMTCSGPREVNKPLDPKLFQNARDAAQVELRALPARR